MSRLRESARSTAGTWTAGALLIGGIAYGYQAVQEGIGSAADAGSGFFPLLVAVALAASSALVLAGELREKSGENTSRGTTTVGAPDGEIPEDDEGGPLQAAVSWWRIVGVLLASVSVPMLAGTVGFVTTLSAAVVTIAKIMGMTGWVKPLLLGVSFGVACWLIFVYWLFVPLPAGSLGLA